MQSIDLTKIQPTNWRYILGLVLVVVIVLACVGIGSWVWNTVKTVGSKTTASVGDTI
jgi:TRAP-type C4-dicarboxylate transport system permease small subunit